MNTSSRNGFLFGLLCPGDLMARREPVAYFYPSVVLPDVESVWTDKVNYPYAFIQTLSATSYVLYLSADVGYVYATSGSKVNCHIQANGMRYVFDTGSESWGSGSSFSSADGPIGRNNQLAIWANYDVINTTDNSIYLAASDPIPAGNGMVAYKGERLPKLPEWDRETYPYAIIVNWGARKDFRVFDIPLAKEGEEAFGTSNYTREMCWMINDGDEEWTSLGINVSQGGLTFGQSRFVWTNTDILDESGDIYLSASDPIPIYE